MSGMFWIALELGSAKMGLNVILSLLVKKLSAFKNDEVAKTGNTVCGCPDLSHCSAKVTL